MVRRLRKLVIHNGQYIETQILNSNHPSFEVKTYEVIHNIEVFTLQISTVGDRLQVLKFYPKDYQAVIIKNSVIYRLHLDCI